MNLYSWHFTMNALYGGIIIAKLIASAYKKFVCVSSDLCVSICKSVSAYTQYMCAYANPYARIHNPRVIQTCMCLIRSVSKDTARHPSKLRRVFLFPQRRLTGSTLQKQCSLHNTS